MAEKITPAEFAELLMDSLEEFNIIIEDTEPDEECTDCTESEFTPEEQAQPTDPCSCPEDEYIDDDGYITPDHPNYCKQSHILESIDDVILNTLHGSTSIAPSTADVLLTLSNVRAMYLEDL